MISNVNEIIKNFIQSHLETQVVDEFEFNFNVPTKGASEKYDRNTINIYLLDVKENIDLRESQWENTYNSDGVLHKVSPTIMLDLYFLITTFSKEKDIEIEYLLFEKTLSALYQPSFATYLNQNVPSNLKREITLELFPQKYIAEHLGLQLWSAIDQNVRPLISLRVTTPLPVEASISMTPVKTKEINYALPDEKVYTIGGKVMGKADNNIFPIQARIELKNQGGETIQTVKSNALGMFSLNQVDTQRHTVHLVASGFQDKEVILENIKMQSTEQLIITLDRSLM